MSLLRLREGQFIDIMILPTISTISRIYILGNLYSDTKIEKKKLKIKIFNWPDVDWCLGHYWYPWNFSSHFRQLKTLTFYLKWRKNKLFFLHQLHQKKQKIVFWIWDNFFLTSGGVLLELFGILTTKISLLLLNQYECNQYPVS